MRCLKDDIFETKVTGVFPVLPDFTLFLAGTKLKKVRESALNRKTTINILLPLFKTVVICSQGSPGKLKALPIQLHFSQTLSKSNNCFETKSPLGDSKSAAFVQNWCSCNSTGSMKRNQDLITYRFIDVLIRWYHFKLIIRVKCRIFVLACTALGTQSSSKSC